jgi:hypothetical protein
MDHDPDVCRRGEAVADAVARRAGMQVAMDESFRGTKLSSGSIVLATYRADRPEHSPVGDVHFSLHASENCSELRFLINDYRSGRETDFVRRLRADLERSLREQFPNAEIEAAEHVVRTLPP